jgi:DNA mismatch repair protein MutL
MIEAGAARRPIARLEPTVIERIAAGEVIDSPDAVVRELVDNALDAGARRVQVELRRGGLDLIRVADDGEGLDPVELPMAFERHSTSKLRTLEELGRIQTLGFRGEALAAIAAVAEVGVLTAVAGEGAAWAVLVRDGRCDEPRRSARERGMTVTVRALFAGTPARLRFQREQRAEVAAIARRVRWTALAQAGVRFELTVDGRLLFQSAGRGQLAQALAEAQGDEVRHHLVQLGPLQLGPYLVEGLLTGGGLTRPSRQHLALFVNRRRVRVAEIEAGLETAYQGLLPRGRHPIGALFVTAPGWAVDLNLHPSKEQVRLEDQVGLAASLGEAVRAALSAAGREPDALQLFDAATMTRPRQVAEATPLWEIGPATITTPRYLAQLQQALLLCEGRQGLILVDQHRAEERVIFERLRRGQRTTPGQSLLEPAIVEVPAAQVELIEARLADLETIGFICERFGDRAYRLRAAPALPESGDLLTFASEALALASERDEYWRDRLLATVACRSAVKKGRPLGATRAAELLEDLFLAEEPAICPHGSPIVLQLSRPFLRRQFRW